MYLLCYFFDFKPLWELGLAPPLFIPILLLFNYQVAAVDRLHRIFAATVAQGWLLT